LNTGKIKRLRNNGTVELAECDFGGTPHGPVVKGTARILDATASDHARRLIRTKYGLIGWLSFLGSTIRRGKQGSVGIEISLTAS
jgi:PPOX class probable F420-dependent enzyme